MEATQIAWFHHIELVGVFLLGIYVAGTLIRILLERWILKPTCAICYPTTAIEEIKEKQSHHREIEHLKLAETLKELTVQMNIVLKSLDDIKDRELKDIRNSLDKALLNGIKR